MTAGLFSKKKYLPSEIDAVRELNTVDVINMTPVIIPKHSFMDGVFSTKRSIRIECAFKGILYSKEKVIIDDDALAQGNIIASEVVISGRVVGNIYCFGKVHVKNGGKIDGNIFSNRFQNDEGSDLSSSITILNNDTVNSLEIINNNILLESDAIENNQIEELIAIFNPVSNKIKAVK
ncbi:MAG: polymer-forming cytoskeletal protein [Chitinophagaceae bacterium]|nr:polymer-forming cytoskeletal protein [Chitinophagaceae bacterium]